MVSKAKKSKTSKSTAKFVKPHNPPKKVRRVNADTSVKSADFVANVLGLDELARELTAERPKTVVPDFQKTSFGQTRAIHTNGGRTIEAEDELNNAALLGLDPNNDKSLEDLINHVRAQSALEKVEAIENLVAEATKNYWQAKRRLVLVTKVLNSVYAEMERSEMKTVELSKEETRQILTEVLEKSFLASN